jgi:hypothetical protein
LRGGILLYAAQAIPPIDTEIAEKGHLWTETSLVTASPIGRAAVGGCLSVDRKDIPQDSRIHQVGYEFL